MPYYDAVEVSGYSYSYTSCYVTGQDVTADRQKVILATSKVKYHTSRCPVLSDRQGTRDVASTVHNCTPPQRQRLRRLSQPRQEDFP